MKAKALIGVIWGVLWLTGLLLTANTLAKAQDSPEISFDKIVFLSSWTQSGTVKLSSGENREVTCPHKLYHFLS